MIDFEKQLKFEKIVQDMTMTSPDGDPLYDRLKELQLFRDFSGTALTIAGLILNDPLLSVCGRMAKFDKDIENKLKEYLEDSTVSKMIASAFIAGYKAGREEL